MDYPSGTKINPLAQLMNNILRRIYINLKEHSVRKELFYYILFLFENMQMILVIDSIFRGFRDDVNIYYPLYFLSPVFLMELSISNLNMNRTSSGIDLTMNCGNVSTSENTATDQIRLIIEQVFYLPYSGSSCHFSFLYQCYLCFLLFLVIFLIVLGINCGKSLIVSQLKMLVTVCLIICLKPFWYFFCFFLTRNLVIDSMVPQYSQIDGSFFICLVLFIFILLMSYYFHIYFLSSYYQMSIVIENSPMEIKIIKIEFVLSLVNGIYLNIRNFYTISIFFGGMVLLLFFLLFYLSTLNYLRLIYKTRLKKIKYFLMLFIFSFTCIRFFTFLVLSPGCFKIWMKIGELCSAFFFFILLGFFFHEHVSKLPLSKLVQKLILSQEESLEWIIQMYSIISIYFERDLNIIQTRSRSSENGVGGIRNIPLKELKNKLLTHFLLTDDDFKLLCNKNFEQEYDKEILSIKRLLYNAQIDSETTFNPAVDCNHTLKLFIDFIQFLKRNLKKTGASAHEANFYKNFQEIIKLTKIIIYYCHDEHIFRAYYYLKKYVSSPLFHLGSPCWKYSFGYINYKFQAQNINEETDWTSTFTCMKITDQYHIIIQNILSLLEHFQHFDEKKAKVKICDEKHEIIGNCYRTIKSLSEEKESHFKDQPPFLLLKLANEMLFKVKDYDKLSDNNDLQLLDLCPERSTYFLLKYNCDELIIKMVPFNFIRLCKKQSPELIDTPYENLFPLAIRGVEMRNIKRRMKQRKDEAYSKETAFLYKDKYIIAVKLQYSIIPIIGKEILIICNFEYGRNPKKVALINTAGNILNIGTYFKRHFQISPHMKNVNAWNLFGNNPNISLSMGNVNHMEQNNQSLYKIIGDKSVEVQFNIKRYISEYYKYLNYSNLYYSGRKDQQVSFNELTKSFCNKNGALIDHIVLKLTILNEYQRKKDAVQLVLFESKESRISASFENNNFPQGEMQKEANFFLFPGTAFSSTASSSCSKTSLGTSFASTLAKQQKKEQQKKLSSVTRFIILLYNFLLLFVAIGGLIFIQFSSTELLNVFNSLKTLRNISFQYFNEAFHVANVIVINNNNIFNSLEMKLKKVNTQLKMNFTAFYKEDFRNMTNDFFQMYLDLKGNCSEYLDHTFFEEKVNVDAAVIQLDGNYYPDKFLNILNNPKNTFYIISNFPGYYLTVPYFNRLLPSADQFRIMNDGQKQLYKAVFNYRVFREKFIEVNLNMREYLGEIFNAYKLKVIFSFLIFLFIHVISFGLYMYDTNIFYNQTVIIMKRLFLVNEKSIELLCEKFKKLKKLIDMELKASDVIFEIKHDYKQLQSICKANKIEVSKNIGVNNNNNLIDTKENAKKDKNQQQTEYYRLSTFAFVKKLIIILNLIYVMYSVLSFPLITNLTKKIEVSQNLNINIVEMQRLMLNYYLVTRWSILLNDTDYPFTTHVLYENPVNISKNMNTFFHYIENSDNLVEMKEFFKQTKVENCCQMVIPNNTYTSDLLKICDNQTVLQTHFDTIISFFLNKLRSNYMNFVASPRRESDVIKFYHSPAIQEANFAHLLFIHNMMKLLKEKFAMPIYTKDINNLVNFSIIMFIVMVITEFVNFIIIRIKVVKRLNYTMKNFAIMEKLLFYEA